MVRVKYFTGLFVVVLYGLSAACAPGAVPVEPYEPVDVEPMVTAIDKPVEEQAPTEASERITLRVWIPQYAPPFEIPADIFKWYEEQSGNTVELLYLPSFDYNDKLMTGLAAGAGPDIGIQPYNQLSESLLREYLLPLDLGLIDTQAVYPDAMQSTNFDGNTFGLPWLRPSCSPDYHYLTVFKGQNPSPERDAAAMKLLDFTNQANPWAENFAYSEWFPTRFDTADMTGRRCEPVAAIRVPYYEVDTMLSLAEQGVRNIASVNQEIIYNPDASAAYTDNSGQIATTISPVAIVEPQEVFREKLSVEEQIVGGIFISTEQAWVPPGDYAVACKGGNYEDSYCWLVSPDGTRYDAKPVIFEYTQAPVNAPTSAMEEGSVRKCFYLDGIKICITIF